MRILATAKKAFKSVLLSQIKKVIPPLQEYSQLNQNLQLEKLTEELEKTRRDVGRLQDFVLEVANLTGGPGWKDTMQNAVMQLDSRITDIKDAVIHHHELFEAIENQNREMMDLAENTPDKELN